MDKYKQRALKQGAKNAREEATHYLNALRRERANKYRDLKEIRRLWVKLIHERAKIKAYNEGDLLKVHQINNLCAEYAWQLMEADLIESY